MAARTYKSRAFGGRLFWKLFFWNTVLLLLALFLSVWLILRKSDDFYDTELGNHLRAHAELLRQYVEDDPRSADPARLEKLAQAGPEAGWDGLRVTFIAASGTVLADSHADAGRMESHLARDEVRRALAEGWGQSVRFSTTTSRQTKYVAVRIGPPQSPWGVVRCAMPVARIFSQTEDAEKILWRIALVALVTSILLALGLARLWCRPITRITATAESLAVGDLSARAEVSGQDELASLARSLNTMRHHLEGQMQTIDHQRLSLEALLSQLGEGVVVATNDGRIVMINAAAARLLQLSISVGSDSRPSEMLTVETCIQPHDLQQILLPTDDWASEAREGQLLTVRHSEGAVTLLARGADILLPAFDQEPSGQQGLPSRVCEPDCGFAGRLLVLTDVTELTRILQMKTDFVVNASHELRTPLAAIRAAVETMMTLDSRDAGAMVNLLKILQRHNSRLEALVADLLDLSAVEMPTARFVSKAIQVRSFLEELHERFSPRIIEKKLVWIPEISLEAGLVTVNPELLRLVMDNLVDNAVKFSSEGGRVAVSVRRDGAEVSITLADDGCGIPLEDQERVFERFYQVDRARTGPERGTGLGLAIVRHAVAAMGGRVHLQSQPGKGTTVSVHLPIKSSVAEH